MIKLSIIVPVYNVELYIEQCITSLLKQTMKEIEIIVVNDGATDKSIDLVKSFHNSQIKIINQSNQGLSAARNKGLKYAKGEYIVFVDSDDFIRFDNAFEEMYNIGRDNNSDIVCGNAIKYYSDEKYNKLNYDFESDLSTNLSGTDFLSYSLIKNRLFVPVWLYMYKREFLNLNSLIFKEGIYHEDEDFTPRVFLNNPKISIYNKCFYVYRQREGSIMKNNDFLYKRALDVLDLSMELNKLFKNIENKNLKCLYMNYLAELVLSHIDSVKMNKIPFYIRKFVFFYVKNKSLKIKSLILLINLKLYYKCNNLYFRIKTYS